MKQLFFILLLISFAARSQTMQGIVTDARTKKPLYPVTVVNVFTQMASSTDEKGLYTIMAKPGDVIAFTYIGYTPVKIVKPPSVIIATRDVQMEQTGIQLKEFSFRPGNLTQYQIDSIERWNTYKVPLQRRPPSAFASPVSAFAEKFSRRAKMTYRFQRLFAQGEMDKYIDLRYTPDLVTSLTGITGDSIGHFMYAYPLPYDFARTASELELNMWVRDNYKRWLKKTTVDTVTGKN